MSTVSGPDVTSGSACTSHSGQEGMRAQDGPWAEAHSKPNARVYRPCWPHKHTPSTTPCSCLDYAASYATLARRYPPGAPGSGRSTLHSPCASPHSRGRDWPTPRITVGGLPGWAGRGLGPERALFAGMQPPCRG